jgi:16S rRNA (guanine527-N7)-methyltransferase
MTPSPLETYEKNRTLFDRYAALLKRWNEKINLTAITDLDQIRKKHFLDSLAPIAIIEKLKNVSRETFRILDIGAGGGFPGLPLKIAFPEIEIMLVDAVKKKCDFMKAAVRELGLKDVKVIHLKLDGKTDLGGKFNVAISRAAFSLKDFLTLALPQRNERGIVIAMKSGDVDMTSKEAQEALPIVEQQRLKLETASYQIEASEPARNLITVYDPSLT